MAFYARRLVSTGTTFSSLENRNYRLYFLGQLVSISGNNMQTVAQSFLVLQLTNSGTQLGLATAARFLPIFVLGPWGGSVVDRVDPRRLLLITQVLSGLFALAFGILTGVHVIQMWMVYLIALCLGCVNVFDNPARQTLIGELVPRSLVQNAVALNSVMVNIARIVGGALAGAVASVLGLAMCFDLNAASYAAVVASLLLIKAAQMYPVERPAREPGQVRAGLSYVRTEPGLLIPLLMVAVVGALAWEFPVSLPLLARDNFHGGAGLYGAMNAAMAVGAVAGGLVTASRRDIRRRSLALASIGWGTAITVAALAPGLVLEFAALLFVGYGSVSFNSLTKTVLQLTTPPTMRGRVMALWGVAWQGSTPIGGPIVGWVGGEFGASASLIVGGIPTILVGLAALPLLTRTDRQRGGFGRAKEAAAADADGAESVAETAGTAGLRRPDKPAC
ncbi:MAG TPA: MFS transporter [Trebonia sp.]|nr:MFS transporter [Trebonia sp.]